VGITTSSGTGAHLPSTTVPLVSRTLVRLFPCVGRVPHIALQDNVIAAAKANNIRLIVGLTNNWKDYGGMDVYVNQILGQGQPHDYFYTSPEVIVCLFSCPSLLLPISIGPC